MLETFLLGEETFLLRDLESEISVKLQVGLLVKCVRMYSLTADLSLADLLEVAWMVSFGNSFILCLFSVDLVLLWKLSMIP